jgi:uncharacterized protein (TIGR00299 family) protein
MLVAYLDCYSGISGDMTLGALLDAGLALDDLQAYLALIDLDGYHLAAEPVEHAGIHGTRLTVHLTEEHQPPPHQHHDHDPSHHHHHPDLGAHRHWSEIRQMLEASRLPAPMRDTALRIFGRLAEAEGAVHGVPPEAVHFHEVGAIDSIVDIVGAAIGIHLLGIERVYAAPLPLGHGFVKTRHGLLPLPAPATLEIIARSGAATRQIDSDKELVTPTGAAIAATLATFHRPALRVTRVGYGFGTMRLPWPNALRLWLGELDEAAPASTPDERPADRAHPGDEVVLETNIDDLPGEVLGYLMERLFAAGALDVYYTPIFMKKNRPAVTVSLIAPVARRAALETILLTETTTFGVRAVPISRTKSERHVETVNTPYGPVRCKVKRWQGATLDLAPEYEDCAALARAHGLPFRVIFEAARHAAAARG